MTFVCHSCGKSFTSAEKRRAENLGDYDNILYDFKTNFYFSIEEFMLPMTLKIQAIIDHYNDYF